MKSITRINHLTVFALFGLVSFGCEEIVSKKPKVETSVVNRVVNDTIANSVDNATFVIVYVDYNFNLLEIHPNYVWRYGLFKPNYLVECKG